MESEVMKQWFITPLLVAGIAAAAPGGAQASELRDCRVERIEGESVRYWQDGTWAPLGTAALPASATKIETGPATRLEIVCDDGIVVTVGVGTEVNLEALAGASGRGQSVILQLIRGIVGIVAPERTWDGFDVRTPLAIASVRSTEWLVEHGTEAGTAIFVREGRVRVRHAGGAALLAEGDGITIPPVGAAGAVKQWGEARIEKSGAALGFGWR